MNFSFLVAKKYASSNQRITAISLISWMATIGIVACSFAFLVVLSAQNGINNLASSLYESTEPHLKIAPKKGKWLLQDSLFLQNFQNNTKVIYAGYAIEELVLVAYKEKQSVVTLKGISEQELQLQALDSFLYAGEKKIQQARTDLALLGWQNSTKLNTFIGDVLSIYYPKKTTQSIQLTNLQDAFYFRNIVLGGIYSINPELDAKYLITSYNFAQALLEEPNRASAIHIYLKDRKQTASFIAQLPPSITENYRLSTQSQENELLSKANNLEKKIVFFVLCFICLIACFNVVGALIMILLEKKKDLTTFQILGATPQQLQNIFLLQSFFNNLIGSTIGISLGCLLCWLQQKYGLIALQGGLVDYYPVEVVPTDLLWILLSILSMGTIAAYFPIKYILKQRNYD